MTASPSVGGISSLAQTPILQQPFVVGPGFSPVPAKLVSQIVAGKFVELHELLSFFEFGAKRARTSIAVRRAAGAYVDSKKAQATR